VDGVNVNECMVGWLTVAVAFVVGSLDVFSNCFNMGRK